MNEGIKTFLKNESKNLFREMTPAEQLKTSKREIFQNMRRLWKAGNTLKREQRELGY